jgi:hypothetical protein
MISCLSFLSVSFIDFGIVALANTVSKSVLATIPNNVVEHLKLKLGNVIEWKTFMHNEKPAARIRKLS